ncbi:MAG: hypothetical protein ABIN89_10830 [Chitinophagaceae bacterium]
MKTSLLITVGVFLSMSIQSCKKTIDKQKENYVLDVLTNGRWFLENYTENYFDYTYDFMEYEFQFYENGKLDAITATSTISGTWVGDVDNLTVTVNFPVTGTQLSRLNHVWQWLGANVGLVFAEIVTPTQKITIRFKKK